MNKTAEFKKTTEIVRYLLTEFPHTRNSDSFLYYKVLEYISKKNGYVLGLMSVPHFLSKMKEYGFPCFESVRRTRQKLQATYPELRACDEVEGFREDNEVAVREYARGAV